MPAASPISRTAQFRTTVTTVETLSPRMRRIELQADEVAETAWPLGCDIAVVLSADGREIRRRYTVRRVMADRLIVDAVLHGHGPGASWAAVVAPGTAVTFYGPRGEVPVTGAGWLLALTDESGLPAVAALAEAIAPRPIRVLAEIADAAEHYPLPASAEVSWVERGADPAGRAERLEAAAAGIQPLGGPGFAYVLGESRAVVRLRDGLARLGLTREDVYAKGYWNLQSRPTR